MRRFQGHRPAVADGWMFDGSIGQAEDVDWLLFLRRLEDRDACSGKLLADGYVINKANYWFILTEAGELIGTDIKILKNNRPEVFNMLARHLMLDEEEDDG